MLRGAILVGGLLALSDPFLLYLLYVYTGMYVVLGAYLGPLLLGTLLLTRSSRQPPPPGLLGMSDGLLGSVLNPLTRVLLLYPGPITSLLGLTLAIPLTRRAAISFVMARMLKNVFPGGGMGMFTALNTDFSDQASGPFAPKGGRGKLKRAHGRIVDNEGSDRLPPGQAPKK